MINQMYMTSEQVDALRNLHETLAAIKNVRKQFSSEQDPANKKEIMGRLISLYASIQEKETSVVAYMAAFSKKAVNE